MSERGSARQEEYARRILTEIESGQYLSQRSLASRVGIALGMTNLLLRRLIRKGLVRVAHVRPNRVGYFLTPTGMAEKARMSQAYFQNSVRLYTSARDRIRGSFDELSRHWPLPQAAGHNAKRIIFVGTGEVAEIAYVCLQETDLELTGVIDFQGRTRFFGVPVYPAERIPSALRQGLQERAVIIIVFGDSDHVQAFIRDQALPAEQIFRV